MINPTCESCEKTVYRAEMMRVNDKVFHACCFKCSVCKRKLSLSNFASMGGEFYCKAHFLENFKRSGGKYEQENRNPNVNKVKKIVVGEHSEIDRLRKENKELELKVERLLEVFARIDGHLQSTA